MRQEGRSSVRLGLENDQKSTLRVASPFALGSGGTETCSLSALGRGRGNGQFVCAGVMESRKSQSARAASIKNESGQPAYAVIRERGNGQPVRAGVRAAASECVTYAAGSTRPRRGQGGGNCQSVCVVVSPNGSGQSVRAGFRSNGNGQPVCAAVKVGRKRSARPCRGQGLKTLC